MKQLALINSLLFCGRLAGLAESSADVLLKLGAGSTVPQVDVPVPHTAFG